MKGYGMFSAVHRIRDYAPTDETKVITPDNLLWKQYLVYADLFKFYVDITWKATTWFYAITGAILVYYFDHVGDDNPFLRYSLVLPIALSFGLFTIYLRGLREVQELDDNLWYIAQKLKLPGKPHVDILGRFLKVGGLLYLLTGVGLLVVFFLSFAS